MVDSFSANSAYLTPAGMKPGISHEAGSEPAEILYRQLFRAPGQPARHLLPENHMTARGAFNLTKGQAFVSDLLLTGETAVANLTEPQAKRCDALAIDGGPGGHLKVRLPPYTASDATCAEPDQYFESSPHCWYPETGLLAHISRFRRLRCALYGQAAYAPWPECYIYGNGQSEVS